MTINVKIDDTANLICVTVDGELTYEKTRRAFDEILNRSDFRRGASAIWDVSNARISADASDLQRIVSHLRLNQIRRGSDYKLAIVVTDIEDKFFLDIFKALAGTLPFETRIFDSVTKANEWVLQSTTN